MELKDLYKTLEFLRAKEYYSINDPNALCTSMLEYNKKGKIWEYYLRNERGRKTGLKVFFTEEEACKHALKEAIDSIRIFTKSRIDAVKAKYLGVDDTSKLSPMTLHEIFYKIEKLDQDKEAFLNDPDQFIGVYTSVYNEKKGVWEFSSDWKTFPTEDEACDHIINKAVETLKAFGKAWKLTRHKKNDEFLMKRMEEQKKSQLD